MSTAVTITIAVISSGLCIAFLWKEIKEQKKKDHNRIDQVKIDQMEHKYKRSIEKVRLEMMLTGDLLDEEDTGNVIYVDFQAKQRISSVS